MSSTPEHLAYCTAIDTMAEDVLAQPEAKQAFYLSQAVSASRYLQAPHGMGYNALVATVREAMQRIEDGQAADANRKAMQEMEAKPKLDGALAELVDAHGELIETAQRERAAAYARGHAAGRKLRDSASSEESEADIVKRVKALAEIKVQAICEGHYAKGYDQGKTDGHRKGYDAGYITGKDFAKADALRLLESFLAQAREKL